MPPRFVNSVDFIGHPSEVLREWSIGQYATLRTLLGKRREYKQQNYSTQVAFWRTINVIVLHSKMDSMQSLSAGYT